MEEHSTHEILLAQSVLFVSLFSLLFRAKSVIFVNVEGMYVWRSRQGPVASVFWLDDALESALRLDAIITLVDAKNIRRQLQRTASSSSLEATRGSDTSERIGPDRGADAATAEENGEVVEKNDTTIHRNEAAIQLAHADRILVNKVEYNHTGRMLNLHICTLHKMPCSLRPTVILTTIQHPRKTTTM